MTPEEGSFGKNRSENRSRWQDTLPGLEPRDASRRRIAVHFSHADLPSLVDRRSRSAWEGGHRWTTRRSRKEDAAATRGGSNIHGWPIGTGGLVFPADTLVMDIGHAWGVGLRDVVVGPATRRCASAQRWRVMFAGWDGRPSSRSIPSRHLSGVPFQGPSALRSPLEDRPARLGIPPFQTQNSRRPREAGAPQ